MDLLARLIRNGHWCATVATECDRSARVAGLEAMSEAHGIFGEPLRPQGAEHVMTRTFRTRLAGPGDGPYQHLGEAETLAIMSARALRGVFVTDDKAVPVIARDLGIQVITTFDLLRAAYRAKFLDKDTLWSYLRTLRRLRRGGPPGVTDLPSFEAWLS